MSSRTPKNPHPKWKIAAALLCALALAPFFVGGASATAVKILLGVGALGVAAAIGVRAARRRTQTKNAPELAVVSRASLSAKVGIAVVEFEGRRLLVGHGDSFVQVLSSIAPRRIRRRKVA